MQAKNKITQISKVITTWLLLLTVTSSAFSSNNLSFASESKLAFQASYYYYASGERIPLTPSLEWISVQFASDDAAEQTKALQDFGALVGSRKHARQITNPKLTLLPLQKGVSIQTFEEGINTLRANTTNFLQVNPVFQAGNTEMVITDQFIATFSPEKSTEDIVGINSAYSAELVEPLLGQENTFILRVLPEARTDSLAMANLYQESGVAIHAAPDFVRIIKTRPVRNEIRSVSALVTSPNDFYYYGQWFLNETEQYGPLMGNADADIDAPEAWSLTNGSSNVIIAIIDTGVDLTHEDLSGKLVPGYDATGGGTNGGYGGNNPMNAHGTSVAGIAAAKTNNTIGVAGVCPLCLIMPVRNGYVDSSGNTIIMDSWSANGITWAYQSGASIINNSWGGGIPSTAITNAISNAITFGRAGKGSVLVFAAGNDNSAVHYPASLGAGFVVSALNLCDQRKAPINDDCNNREFSWGSNYGPEVNISAASVLLHSTDIMGVAGYSTDNYFLYMNGTSGAAPIVSGVAGLVLSACPNLTQSQVKTIMESSADDLYEPGRDILTGYGRVNAHRAVQAALFSNASHNWNIRCIDSFVYGTGSDKPVIGDYNGDGKDDIAVFRPSNGTWYIRGLGNFVYGASSDKPVVGDYNGDGKDDIAVFRESNSTWYIYGVGPSVYGTTNDIPVVGDYNGDGKDDIAVFRPSNSTWYIHGVGSAVYGAAGDIPVVADYNGDKKADIAVFRPSNSTWYIRGVGPAVYGAVGDIPVAADYNGDGKDDLAVFRPSNSTWYIRGVGPAVYGAVGDIPVVADYNGDKKADIAVFRP